MRKQTIDDLRTIRNEKDFLNGNINRMCVTDDFSELNSMKEFAIRRIEHIYQVNFDRLSSSDNEKKYD